MINLLNAIESKDEARIAKAAHDVLIRAANVCGLRNAKAMIKLLALATDVQGAGRAA